MRVEAFLAPHSWDAVSAQVRWAEAVGFDSVATPEIANDPFVTLAVAAQHSTRVGLRTAIAVAFPRSPMVVAGAAFELHANTGGRFSLGLGTQVKGHNERRFSVPWTRPASRLREYVEAVRAIWRCWQLGERLDHQGEHYQFSLMTPEFAHRPVEHPPIPIHTAAVRPAMLRTAGRVADGVRLHLFCTRKYLEQSVLPNLQLGLAEAGRARESFEVCGGGVVATGPDEAAVAKALEWVRYRVAFYGSTRTYWPVFEAHGWLDLGEKLHELSKTGRWKEMAACVPDEVVREFAAVGTWDQLPAEIARRFGGIVDSIEIAAPEGAVDPGPLREVLQDIRAIPAAFTTPRTEW